MTFTQRLRDQSHLRQSLELQIKELMDFKSIIEEELRNQIRDQVDFGYTIGQWVDDMLENDESWVELVISCMKESIINKFK